MTIGVNWKAVWKHVWKLVWKQATPVPPPPKPPTPQFAEDGAGIPGARKKLSYFEEAQLLKARQEKDDLEIARVLTEFLSRI